MSMEKPAETRSLFPARYLLRLGLALSALLLMSRALLQHLTSEKAALSGSVGASSTEFAVYLWIGLGSALGGMARYWCSVASVRLVGPAFPWGTLFINVTGSLAIGFFAALTGPDGRLLASPTARQFVMAGLCGGYTTFSAFSLQSLNLMRAGEWLGAGGNIFLSLVLCLLAVSLGHALALSLNTGRWM
jgi:fluoride exporter